MVDLQVGRDVVYKICPVCKREVRKFFIICAKDIDPAFGKHFLEQQGGDVAKIAVSPNADGVPARVGNFVKTGDGVHGNGNNLRKRRHIQIDVFRQGNEPCGGDLHVFLQKAVCGRTAEFGGAQVILRNIRVCFAGNIRNHNDSVPAFESAGAVQHHPADPFVDQRHGQLLGKHFGVPCSKIISHIRVADGKVGGAHHCVAAEQVYGFKRHLKSSRLGKAVDGVYHSSSSSKRDLATRMS